MNLLDYLKKIRIEFEITKNGLNVGGSLDLENTQITELPDGLNVGGSLDLRGTQITELPDGLNVGGSLYLDKTIRNAAFKDNCGRQSRTIFAAMIGVNIKIGAGCFLGSISEFCDRVDDEYSTDSAEKYKQDAQECVNNLVTKLETESTN